MAEFTIRSARIEDGADIVRLIAEHAALDNERSPLTPAYVAQYLSTQGSMVLLAEADGQVVGLLSGSRRPDLYHAGEACLIEELVVKEGRRGQGIGDMLIRELLARLAVGAPAEISVAVMKENHGAIRFYTAHGFCDEALLLEMHFPTRRPGT